MDIQDLIEAVLAREIAPVPAPSEADYHRAWLEHDVNAEELVVAAALGGALADRLAWVFLAGYQATIRRCFPSLAVEPGWCVFVNTEDRTGTLPGTSLSAGPPRRFNGWKTWLAAADHADRLLVSASQESTPFLVLPRDYPGVIIENGPLPGYLPELVQGRVRFEDVAVDHDQLIGDERTFPMFRATESAYVRAALFAFMLAHALRLHASPVLVGGSIAGLLAMKATLELALPSDAAAVAMFGADGHARSVAAQFEAVIEVKDPPLHQRWVRDRRLVEGASDRLLARAADVLERTGQHR